MPLPKPGEENTEIPEWMRDIPFVSLPKEPIEFNMKPLVSRWTRLRWRIIGWFKA